MANTAPSGFPEAIRLHIPRALRVVYDIRNKRDAAHLGDGIDPNLQDATLVISILDWVLAEFIRLYHTVSADEAQRMVNGIVSRLTPVIEEFDGFLKILNTKVTSSNHSLLLLYHRGKEGASFDQLSEWARPAMRRNLRRTLSRLVDDKAFVHFNGKRYFITMGGQAYVEAKRLVDVSPA